MKEDEERLGATVLMPLVRGDEATAAKAQGRRILDGEGCVGECFGGVVVIRGCRRGLGVAVGQSCGDRRG